MWNNWSPLKSIWTRFWYPSLRCNRPWLSKMSLFFLVLSDRSLKQCCCSLDAFIKMHSVMNAFIFPDQCFNDRLDMMNWSPAVGRGLRSYPSKCDILVWIKNASVPALITPSSVYYSSWKPDEACWSAFPSQLPYLVRKWKREEGEERRIGETRRGGEGKGRRGRKGRQFLVKDETDPSLSDSSCIF